MIGWILLIISIGLATQSLWWLIVTLLIILFKLNHWWFYLSRPWRRVHYPSMRAYSAIIGHATGREEQDGTPMNINECLKDLICARYPDMESSEIDEFFYDTVQRCDRFEDRELVENYLSKKNSNVDSGRLNELLDKITPHWKSDDNNLMVKMIIAGFIEKEFTMTDRGEYIYEVITNRAK